MKISKLVYLINGIVILSMFISCNNSKNDKVDFIGNKPKKLIVNIKDVSTIKTTFGSDIKYELLYYANDIINDYKTNNPEIAKNYTNDKDLFYDKIYTTLEEWEKELHHSLVVTVYSKRELEKVKERLLNDKNVEFIQENKPKKLHYVPNDPYYSSLWGCQKINCAQSWDFSEGNDVIVAVIDDGTYTKQEDLKDNLWKGSHNNFGFNLSEENNFYDVNPTNGNFHGTHVAGTICATANNLKGIIGVAPKAKILTLKVFPNANDINCANAFYFAIKNNAKVINNSWGPIGRDENNLELSRVIHIAFKKNIVVVFSAGNDNDDVKYYAPANNSRVIAVAATDINDKRCNFSNYGTQISVSAPGKDILSLNATTNGLSTLSGTSMAAPHVSGLAALLLKTNPNLTSEQVKILIETNSSPITNPDRPIGFGRINAFNSINSAITTQSHNVQISFNGRVTDHDDIGSNEVCDFYDTISFNVFPNGINYTSSYQTSRCDNEVWVKFDFSYTMDVNKIVQISGVVYLFDGDNLQGSKSFNSRINYGQNGAVATDQIDDGENEDQSTYRISINNTN